MVFHLGTLMPLARKAQPSCKLRRSRVGGVHIIFPVERSPHGFGQDIAQRQPKRFDRGLVIREVAARLDDLAQLHVQALNGVGRINDPSNLRKRVSCTVSTM